MCVIRYFGYNNEEEVAERDLMDSLGQDAIKEQIEMAEEDKALEEEEEEEGAGDEYRCGMMMMIFAVFSHKIISERETGAVLPGQKMVSQ